MVKDDITGRSFGKLRVIKDSGLRNNGIVWVCQCECGNIVNVRSSNLKSGHTQSCGCYAKQRAREASTIHSKSHTRLYIIWVNMKSRCYNHNVRSFKNYGAKGITVCDEWKNSFKAFAEWSLQNGYNDKLTIDRISNFAGYSPSNCRWVTEKQQQNNRTNNRIISYNGEAKTLSQWSEVTGKSAEQIDYAIKKGKPLSALLGCKRLEAMEDSG